MFIGFIPVKDIKTIYHFDYNEKGQPLKQYTVKEAKKILNIEDDFQWELNMTPEEILQKISEIEDYSVEQIIKVYSKHIDELNNIAEMIHLPRILLLRLKQYLKNKS